MPKVAKTKCHSKLTNLSSQAKLRCLDSATHQKVKLKAGPPSRRITKSETFRLFSILRSNYHRQPHRCLTARKTRKSIIQKRSKIHWTVKSRER